MIDVNSYTWSEEYRFRCEVRQLIKWHFTKPSGTVISFLNGVQKERKKSARDKLESEFWKQISKGNRGNYNEWVE